MIMLILLIIGINWCCKTKYGLCAMNIGIVRGGHGRAFALPSLNFALPSKPSSYLDYIEVLV